MAAVRRGFSNVAAQVTLVGALDGTSSTNTITVSSTPTGWPASTPYFAVIDKGTASEEVVLVTAQAGSSVTITRGSNLASTYGSTTRAHSNGAIVQHVATAADFDEANAHVMATTNVHGITSGLVGLSDTQTLSNKTLTSPVLNSPTLSGAVSLGTPTISSFVNAQHTHADAANGGSVTLPLSPPWQVGLTSPLAFLGNATLSSVTGSGNYWQRFKCEQTMTVNKIYLALQTTSSTYDVGIYADSAGVPGSKVVSSGITGAAATGFGGQAFTVASTTLTAGNFYWLAMNTSASGTCSWKTVDLANSAVLSATYVGRQNNNAVLAPGATLPGTAPALNVVDNLQPLMWLQP